MQVELTISTFCDQTLKELKHNKIKLSIKSRLKVLYAQTIETIKLSEYFYHLKAPTLIGYTSWGIFCKIAFATERTLLSKKKYPCVACDSQSFANCFFKSLWVPCQSCSLLVAI